MGNKSGKVILTSKEVTYARDGTKFNEDEIQALYSKFAQLRSTDADAKRDIKRDSISLPEFQKSLGFGAKRSLFAERVFKVVFDKVGSGQVTFKQFVDGIHRLSAHGSKDEKVRIAFGIMDVRGEGKITREDLKTMLKACFDENGIETTELTINRMVEETFRAHDLNIDGFISEEEYATMVRTSPGHMDPISLNVATVLEAVTGRHRGGEPEGAAAGGGRK